MCWRLECLLEFVLRFRKMVGLQPVEVHWRNCLMSRECQTATARRNSIVFQNLNGNVQKGMQSFIQDFADGGHPGSNGGGSFSHWRNQKRRVFQTREFSKTFIKSMKNLYFLKMLKEILRFLKFFGFFQKFSRKLKEKVRKFPKYAFIVFGGGWPPPHELAKLLKT